ASVALTPQLEVTLRFVGSLAGIRVRDRKCAGRLGRKFRRERIMAAPQFTPEELDELRALAARWAKIASRRAFGDDGPGLDVDFRTFERIAAAAAQGLTGEHPNCPSNGKPTSPPITPPVPTAASPAPRGPTHAR